MLLITHVSIKPLNRIVYAYTNYDLTFMMLNMYILSVTVFMQCKCITLMHVAGIISRNDYVPVIGKLACMSLQKTTYDDTYMK